MATSHANVSKNRRNLEKEIKNKKSVLEQISPTHYKSTSLLSEMIDKKKEEIKGCWWFQFFKQSELIGELDQLRDQFTQLTSLEEKQSELEDLQEQLDDITPGQVWEGYPETLDKKIVDKYMDKFKTLTYPLTPKVPYINIIMIGETGSGKSSCLNTFATALSGCEERIYVCRESPEQGKEKSATKRIHLEALRIGKNGPQLPCKFYDLPGLDKENTIRINEIQKIIDGELRIDVEIHKDSKESIVRENPTFADKVHCILYVLKANSNFSNRNSEMIKLMREIKEKQNAEDGVGQFLLVTAIDELDVPNDDMKNAYRYRCVKNVCKEASKALDVDLLHVLPVSNYVDEPTSNDAKNAMSLFNLWRVFNLGKDYIERQTEIKETYEDFKRLLMQRE